MFSRIEVTKFLKMIKKDVTFIAHYPAKGTVHYMTYTGEKKDLSGNMQTIVGYVANSCSCWVWFQFIYYLHCVILVLIH